MIIMMKQHLLVVNNYYYSTSITTIRPDPQLLSPAAFAVLPAYGEQVRYCAAAQVWRAPQYGDLPVLPLCSVVHDSM